ncbi:MAG: tetratricopeptide repeat protein [Candidatus Aphodosoma sp.]
MVKLTTWAISQPGYVRTISRPNHKSERLNGVLIRVRGNHNPIVSNETGDFFILMQELEIGDPYTLSAVIKSGYQLIEQDVIGRNHVGSDKVPLVISMISIAQLQAEKSAIANKARAEMEKRYLEQMALLEQQLNTKTLMADEYEHRILELDEQYMRLQSQLDNMAYKYARTDYDALDATAAQIQLAIEQGDIVLAESLIREKGSLTRREERIQNLHRAAIEELEDMQRDCYHLYSISLSRFQPDSADYYLKCRADIDTTNAATQLDYAQFLNEYQRDPNLAYEYVLRAERWVRRSDGKRSMLMLRVLNEIGQYHYRKANYLQAVSTYTQAVSLSEELYGADNRFTATRLVNLGASYYALEKNHEARKHFTEAIRIYHLPGQGDSISEAKTLNNLGGIAFAEKDYSSARTYFEQAISLLPKNDAVYPTTLANLADLCAFMKDTISATQYYQEAYEASLRVLGKDNELTKYLKTKGEF